MTNPFDHSVDIKKVMTIKEISSATGIPSADVLRIVRNLELTVAEKDENGVPKFDVGDIVDTWLAEKDRSEANFESRAQKIVEKAFGQIREELRSIVKEESRIGFQIHEASESRFVDMLAQVSDATARYSEMAEFLSKSQTRLNLLMASLQSSIDDLTREAASALLEPGDKRLLPPAQDSRSDEGSGGIPAESREADDRPVTSINVAKRAESETVAPKRRGRPPKHAIDEVTLVEPEIMAEGMYGNRGKQKSKSRKSHQDEAFPWMAELGLSDDDCERLAALFDATEDELSELAQDPLLRRVSGRALEKVGIDVHTIKFSSVYSDFDEAQNWIKGKIAGGVPAELTFVAAIGRVGAEISWAAFQAIFDLTA
jgi:transcriptional regulator NrdR family protein